MSDNLDNWISPAVNKNVLVPVTKSAFESATTRVELSTTSEYVPFAAAYQFAGYAPGQTIALSDVTDARVQLTLVDVCTAGSIPASKMNDSLGVENVVSAKQERILFDLAVQLDNAGFAVTGTPNGGNVPFNSVYRRVKAGTPGNVVATAGALTFGHLSDALAVAEASEFADDIVIVAHTTLKGKMRAIKDGDGRYVLAEGVMVDGKNVDQFAGYPVVWSRGLKTSATVSGNPQGNALFIAAPRQELLTGAGNLPTVPNSLPGFAMQSPAEGIGFLSNSYTIKACVRRDIAVHDTTAIGIVEITAS